MYSQAKGQFINYIFFIVFISLFFAILLSFTISHSASAYNALSPADNRAPITYSENEARVYCATNPSSRRGAIWFTPQGTYYYRNSVDIAAGAGNIIQVQIRGSFFTCASGISGSMGAHWLYPGTRNASNTGFNQTVNDRRLLDVPYSNSAVLARGSANGFMDWSSQGGSINARFDVTGLAVNDSGSSQVPNCNTTLNYCQKIAINLYRCPISASPPSTRCYPSPINVYIVRSKGSPPPQIIPPANNVNVCNPMSFSVSPGSDYHGAVIPVRVTTTSIGAGLNQINNYGSYSNRTTVNVTPTHTTGYQYNVRIRETRNWISGYTRIYHWVYSSSTASDGTTTTTRSWVYWYTRTDWTQARTWNSTIGPCYDYKLTSGVTSLNTYTVEPGGSVSVLPRLTVNSFSGIYRTKTRNTEWRLTKSIYSPNTNVPTIQNQDSSADSCSHFGYSVGADGCSVVASATNSVFSRDGVYISGTNPLTYRNVIVDDYDAGTKICFAFSVRVRAARYDTWTDNRWNHSALDPVRNCVIVSKKPKVQVWGGDLSVISPPINNSAVTTTSVKSNNTFGSWVEYGIFATGLTRGIASGSAFANIHGLYGASSMCRYSTLSFTNSGCSGSNVGSYSKNIPMTDVESIFPSAGSTINTGSVVVNNLLSGPGTYIGTRTGNLTLTDSNLDSGKTIILKVSGTVTITDDLTYSNDPYNNIKDIPQLVIIANNINIDSSVVNVDAWLIAKNGYVNTCSSAGTSNPLSINICSRYLRVNGPVIAKKIYLRRTAGSGTGLASGEPAEVFNLRADAYLWAYSRSSSDNRMRIVYYVSVPPRF